jgi:hypothetical protein
VNQWSDSVKEAVAPAPPHPKVCRRVGTEKGLLRTYTCLSQKVSLLESPADESGSPGKSSGDSSAAQVALIDVARRSSNSKHDEPNLC